ncbi:MAG TPA: IS200/IS605 family transposase [Phycisphaerales bacterium]|nr:IS200/IS605 family transposase [Phycisphaerales bacterium]
MGHTFSSLLSHLVFSTKNRDPWIQPEMEQRLFSYCATVAQSEGGRILCMNGMPDHVHLLLSLKPTVAPSNSVRAIKANSSRFIHETFADHRRFAWQGGYAIFSVSESVSPKVRGYIDDQKSRHGAMRFEDEYVQLLDLHNLPYETQYLFDDE